MTLEYSRTSTAGPLVLLTEAKIHLRITGTADDADITQKLDAAEEAILAYENLAADPTWTDTTVPKAVKHAVLLLLTHYWENRGEELTRDEDVWAAIGRLLALYRDPTIG